MNRLVLALLLLVSFSVSAKQLTCSIHLSKDTPASSLPSLAKISRADAEKTALARINASSRKVVDAELETEQGCLLYSFDIRFSGDAGIDEIWVDAGTGKILWHKHKSPKQEAAKSEAKVRADESPHTSRPFYAAITFMVALAKR